MPKFSPLVCLKKKENMNLSNISSGGMKKWDQLFPNMRSENKEAINPEKIIYFDKKYLQILKFEHFDQLYF